MENVLELIVTHKKMISIIGAFVLLAIWMIAMGIAFKKSDPLKPKGRFLALSEYLMEYFTNFCKEAMQEHRFKGFVPLAITIFMSIFLTNITGLILLEEGAFFNPIYTFTWSIGMFLAWNIYAIIKIKPIKFIKNITTPILLTPLNIIGMITKPVSLGLRLLGNVSAGTFIMVLFWQLPYMVFNMISNLNFFSSGIIGVICGIILTTLGAALSGYFSLFGPFIQATVFTTLTLSNFEEALGEEE